MNIKPVASPSAVQQPPSRAAEKRAAAINAFNQSQTPQQPPQQVVQNQTTISPEEMSAIIPPTERQTDENVEEIQADTTETLPVEPPKQQEDPALSRQFAQLARQEKALRAKAQQQEQTLRAKEAELAAREAKLTGQPQFDPKQYYTKDQLKQDALSVLAEAGVSYEELTQQIISQQPTDPRIQRTINQLQQQVEELKQANEQAKKSYADNQTQAYQAAVKQISEDVNKLVYTDPSFEAIKATKSAKDVVELITKTYDKDGILLTVEEAAQQVEEYLVEEGLRIANIGKIKRKLTEVAPKSATSTAKTPAEGTKQPQPMKTLTNATSTQRKLTAKERAILAFKGELKS